MAGIVSKRMKSGKTRAWFMDRHREQVFFTGTTNPKETLALACRLEDRQTRIRVGDLPEPKASDLPRAFQDAAAEYVAWGRAQGGTGGRGWAPEHAEKRETLLAWWKDRLGLAVLKDLDGIQPRVEEAIRALLTEDLTPLAVRHRTPHTIRHRTPLTVRHYVSALLAFCEWAFRQSYLEDNPLKRLTSLPRETHHTRRALTAKEIRSLLDACHPRRRLTYEAALCSGLRANELRSLTARHLDAARGGLRLDPIWTKNRKAGFQPLPAELVARLTEATQNRLPDAPLLHVGRHPARDLDKDLKRAGILKDGPGGKIDFHALRVAFISCVLEGGASVKEAMDLARHRTPDLTVNTYGRASTERKAEVAEAVGEGVLEGRKYAQGMHRLAAGAEGMAITMDTGSGYKNAARGGADSHALPPVSCRPFYYGM